MIILSAPVPNPFLWTLDLGFGSWIWDSDLGLDLGLTITVLQSSELLTQLTYDWEGFRTLVPCMENFFS